MGELQLILLLVCDKSNKIPHDWINNNRAETKTYLKHGYLNNCIDKKIHLALLTINLTYIMSNVKNFILFLENIDSKAAYSILMV